MTEIQITAVGDLMVKRYIISDAKQSDGTYSFDTLFARVAPYLKQADLTIGNLETTFAGSGRKSRKSLRSGGPIFKCPDELAPALKEAGFDVLVTANNHCMDHGSPGLIRTIQVLDRNGIYHTGTSKSFQESKKTLIQNVKGITIGILSYTSGTNRIPVPASRPWLVNRIETEKIIREIRDLKKKVDLVLLYMHFGNEYRYTPNKRQKQLVNLFFKNGANIILGSHPHVLQPLAVRGKKQFVIYSLGNFVSTKLKNNPYTQSGIILTLKIKKDQKGNTSITNIDYIPTCVDRRVTSGGKITEVIPIRDALKASVLKTGQINLLNRMLKHTTAILKRE
ncbi:CapA family protein [Paenibacillus wynnii]|uniref:CapA family protein n=1 Tax=Paenibacillus wynnii TaxID=268407 RepID=UPI00278D0996|nr:CapA family protein [Paenibacillus wynnii]MDQ0193986.1 poly-gamma-glutamate synthesis protein (capsule biosynthesis protein) [Paenibacillus wynnii]